jgi:chromosome partitioning protein
MEAVGACDVKVITLHNLKGGCAKTTTAVTLAVGLAIKGYNVLLIDSDAQGHASIALGLQKQPGFYDLLVRGEKFEDTLLYVPPERYALPDDVSSITGRLMLLPSNAESRNIANQINGNDVTILLTRLVALRGIFDYVIIDTSPTPSLLHSVIYIATDAILYPTVCEAYSFDGLIQSMAHKDTFDPFRQTKNMPPIDLMGIIPTLYRGKTVEHSENLASLVAEYGDVVWKPIKMSIVWAEAAGQHKSIFAIAPESGAARQAWQVVNRVEAYYVKA